MPDKKLTPMMEFIQYLDEIIVLDLTDLKNKMTELLEKERQMEWIDAKKEQPKLDEHENYYHVIAVVNGETCTDVVYMKEGNKFISNFDTTTQTALNVTHWMPLPEPPKK